MLGMDLLESEVAEGNTGASAPDEKTEKSKRKPEGDGGQPSKKAKGVPRVCIVGGCGQGCIGRIRFCRYHKQCLDGMYYHMVEKPFGGKKGIPLTAEQEKAKQEAKEHYTRDMADDTHAAKLVEEYSKDNLAGKRFRKGITWAEFSREFSKQVGERAETRVRPVEKMEYILRLINKKGWSRTCYPKKPPLKCIVFGCKVV
eukprot:6492760-Amphidinium_carterae.2